jgi:hypothetical protein
MGAKSSLFYLKEKSTWLFREYGANELNVGLTGTS